MGAGGKAPPAAKSGPKLQEQKVAASPEKHSCALRDLSRREKEKVARLIRKVVEQTEEIQLISNKHQQAMKLMQQLKAKNQDIVRDNVSLKAKLAHSFALLQTYQHKIATMGRQQALIPGPVPPNSAAGAQPLQPFLHCLTGQAAMSGFSTGPSHPRPMSSGVSSPAALQPLALGRSAGHCGTNGMPSGTPPWGITSPASFSANNAAAVNSVPLQLNKGAGNVHAAHPSSQQQQWVHAAADVQSVGSGAPPAAMPVGQAFPDQPQAQAAAHLQSAEHYAAHLSQQHLRDAGTNCTSLHAAPPPASSFVHPGLDLDAHSGHSHGHSAQGHVQGYVQPAASVAKSCQPAPESQQGPSAAANASLRHMHRIGSCDLTAASMPADTPLQGMLPVMVTEPSLGPGQMAPRSQHLPPAADPCPAAGHVSGQPEECGWIDRMQPAAVRQEDAVQSGSETSRNAARKGQVIRFDPTIGPHGAFCYEEPHSPVKVAPLQAENPDGGSDVSSGSAPHGTPQSAYAAPQPAGGLKGVAQPHQCCNSRAQEPATAMSDLQGKHKPPSELSECAASSTPDQLRESTAETGRAHSAAGHDGEGASHCKQQNFGNHMSDSYRLADTKTLLPSGNKSRDSPDIPHGSNGYQSTMGASKNFLSNADGQSCMQRAQQAQQTAGLPCRAGERRASPAPRQASFVGPSGMQQFDPGLTDLIREVDSLVSTPARRPVHSDWNWLDQQLASRQAARCRGVSAAGDALSEASWSQWDSLCEENDVISLISEQDL
ncbi:hypothetical protein WJX74_008787 [Apatococcus lobatus]|uniref:Uncharacterized protein n=1 Tax=Apatococcus lobatus TaxID=904363 RepID=A0AAW1QIU3_9CHLO